VRATVLILREAVFFEANKKRTWDLGGI